MLQHLDAMKRKAKEKKKISQDSKDSHTSADGECHRVRERSDQNISTKLISTNNVNNGEGSVCILLAGISTYM